MGGTARQFNKMYIDYKKKFKKPIQQIAVLMPENFTDEYFVPPINAEPRFGEIKIIYLLSMVKRADIILESHTILY